MKEFLRSLLSTPPAQTGLRLVTRHSPMSLARRQRVYLAIGKKVRQQPDQIFVHQVPGGTPVHFHLDGFIRELYWVGAYEDDSLPLFLEYARGSRCILDIGAAEGEYALLSASVSPDAAVWAFEPGAEQAARLTANIKANVPGLGDRVTALEVALSDYTGEAQFYEAGGNSSLNPDFRQQAVPRSVSVARGDDLMAELVEGLKVDLIKIDTESTEPAVLEGLRRTITEDRPVIFCEVLRGRTEERLQVLLDDFGYDTWWLGPDGPVQHRRIEGHPVFLNWLFLPRGRKPLPNPA